jgi:ATP-dependent Clp protease protease subunit
MARYVVRLVGSIVIALSVCLGAVAQDSTPTAAQPERIAVVSFLVQVDSNSVNQLLRVVTDQMRQGTKKIVVIISSPGGDTASAFAAYNVLRHLPIELTTFNVGNIDSAAMLLYCAGTHRYSLPKTRFLIHGNSLTFGVGVPMDSTFLDAQLEQLKNLNQIVIQVVSATAHKKDAEVEKAVHSQEILGPEEAKEWGLVQDIRKDFMEPGAVMVSVNATVSPESKMPVQFSSITATATAP